MNIFYVFTFPGKNEETTSDIEIENLYAVVNKFSLVRWCDECLVAYDFLLRTFTLDV